MNINKKIAGFSFIYISIIALLIIFFTFSSNKKELVTNDTSLRDSKEVKSKLISESQLLSWRLQKLQKLDKLYSALFIQSTVTPAMDSIDTEIAQQEYLFSKIIDSFELIKRNYSKENKLFADGIDTFFKQSLESRRTIGNIRYALAAGNFDFDSSQKKWLKLNSDLMAREERISTLENLLNADKPPVAANDLTLENQQLRFALNEQEKKTNELNNANALLKQNVKTINDAFSKIKETVNSGDKEEKNNVYENINEELKAEIQLATINCNLARADVKQIVSNSKQRKELLSEALIVLNSLSKSTNPKIRNQAKEKLNELYKISEIVRD